MRENDLVFSFGSVSATDVNLEFADSWHILPAWMVAHLGGTEAVTSPASLELARTLTFEEFNHKFHQKASKQTLLAIQKQVIRNHLRLLPKQLRKGY